LLSVKRPASILSRQPTGVGRRRSGSASGSEGERAESAARAARRAALKPYRKFSHRRGETEGAERREQRGVLSRLMLYTWTPLDTPDHAVGVERDRAEYRAVLEVLAGVPVTEVADRYGVSRQSVYAWLGRYRDEGPPGLADHSHRVLLHPWQIPAELEVAVCELRRAHRKWPLARSQGHLSKGWPRTERCRPASETTMRGNHRGRTLPLIERQLDPGVRRYAGLRFH